MAPVIVSLVFVPAPANEEVTAKPAMIVSICKDRRILVS